MIVGLFPELSAVGGVQRAGRLVAAALATFAARQGETYRFLSLNDPPSASPLRIGSQEISFIGFDRSKARFFASAMRAAMQQPRLVVALHPHLAPVVAAMKVCAPRVRTAVFTHGIDVWTPLGLVRRWALQRSDIVLAPSADTLKRLLVQQGIPERKAHKLPWSLGPEFDAKSVPCASRQAPEGFPRGRVILTVGRWDAREAYKGVDHLIEALPVLLGVAPDLHLVAIGDGSDLPRLEGLARQFGVAEQVHFLRHLQPEQLWAAYDLCELFALPSRGEGFGLVFLEAMAHGKPVVGGAHGGTPEIVEDGTTGYLVRHGDIARLTEVLRQLLTDEASRRRMGALALESVRRNFTYDRFSGEFARLVEDLLAFRQGGGGGQQSVY